MRKIFLILILMVFFGVQFWGQDRLKVVIDPGEGGRNPGAIGIGGILEKDINLAIAKLIFIKASADPEIKVILTRHDDRFIAPGDRVAFANGIGADIFISVQANAFYNSSVHGVETLIHETAGQESLLLAQALQRNLIRHLGAHDRGIKRQPLFIRKAQMPAALVEVGFITNPIEVLKLQKLHYQAKIAEAILAGIKEFVRISDLK
jgi:N-acetylmuramoyl-L-alanine amidase